MSQKKMLLSGIQPTNNLTLGNYLGAIKKIVDFQDKYEIVLFVADLHARSLPLFYHKFNFSDLEKQKLEIVKWYIACGIDLTKTKVFYQSDVKGHLELFYFLLSHSTFGELKIMTQYKYLTSKLTEPNGTTVEWLGLLCYPILMAADILLYDADFIAVGKDQTQHLELTSRLAEKINSKYGKNIFKKPKNFDEINNLEDSLKIMDLQNPDKKMSKTCDDVMGVIFLNDTPEKIKAKIMKAKTDSIGVINLDIENQPGIFNLLQIYANIHNISIQNSFEIFKNESYFSLKNKLANDLCEFLEKIQNKYKQIDKDEEKLRKNLLDNAIYWELKTKEKMNDIFKTI